jgi:hypothetical protein
MIYIDYDLLITFSKLELAAALLKISFSLLMKLDESFDFRYHVIK